MADAKIVRLKTAAGTVVRVSEAEAKTLTRGFTPEAKPTARASKSGDK